VHPDHRGRGIAQELLRYVFAFFGGQGVSHFIVEVSEQNTAALQLFSSFGFKRCAKVTHFNLVYDSPSTSNNNQQLTRATSKDSYGLYQLFQDTLPPDIRVIFSYTPEDFTVSRQSELEKLKNKIAEQQIWYWMWENQQRQTITSAVRVVLNKPSNIYLDFAIHPGWKDQAQDFIQCCLNQLQADYPEGTIATKVFDFETAIIEALQANNMKPAGQCCFLAREHWVRAKQSKVQRNTTPISSIANPAVNFPLATDI
jgi:hypothetical protein